jgi:MFS family permease
MREETIEAGSGIAARDPVLPALALGLGAFLTQFDVTAVVVAMPAIGRDLGFGIAGHAWVMDAYSLAFTAALLAAGALADRHGRRRALLHGNALFLLASLACGLAWDGPSLWIARAVQGVGAAFVVTGAISLVAGAYPTPAGRARAFGLIGMVSGIAMALGPTLGGFVASWFGWRWIFLVNGPACLLLALAVPRLLPESRAPEARPIDVAGIALLTLALGAAIEGLLQARSSPLACATGLGIAAAALAAFAAQQRRRAAPILEPAVFGRPEIAAVAVVLLALSVGYWAALVYLPLFLQAAFGWGEQTVGVALLAGTLPMLVLPALGGRLAASWGWRRFFATALWACAAGGACLAAAAPGWSDPVRQVLVFAGMVAIGTGAALAHPQLSGAVIALVPADRAGMASALTVVMRQGGFALGIAALGAVLPDQTAPGGYAASFAVAVLASILGAAAALRLPRRA